ncbi:hypothetical protein JCM8547_000726 [Rhodosporidiobolus lusitaniae]
MSASSEQHASAPVASLRSSSPSPHRAHLPSAALSLAAGTSSTSCPSPPALSPERGFPSASLIASHSPPSSPTSSPESSASASHDITRNHFRTQDVVEASGVPAREFSWRCRGAEGLGLQLQTDVEKSGRSWEEDVPDQGVPCPQPEEVRAVHSSTCTIERAERPEAAESKGAMRRRRSLHGDRDSPD